MDEGEEVCVGADVRGVEFASAVVKGDEGERRDWEEGGVTGVGVEVWGGKWRWRGRGEVPALVELEMESLRLSGSKELRLEREFSLLEDVVDPSRLKTDTVGFTPLSHISAEGHTQHTIGVKYSFFLN